MLPLLTNILNKSVGKKLPPSSDFEDLSLKKKDQEKNNGSAKFRDRHLCSYFGTDSFIVLLIWEILHIYGRISKSIKANPFHSLWFLNFMKNYKTESEGDAKFDSVDEKC